MTNASRRKDIRRAEKASAQQEKERVDYIVASMGTIQGRRWFHRLLSECSLFNDPFTGDTLLDNFIKGQRNIGLSVYNDIVRHCPDLFVRMMNEAAIQEELNERRNADDRADDDRDFNGADESDDSASE